MLQLQQLRKNDKIFLRGVNMINLFANIKPSNIGKIIKILEANRLTLPKNVNMFTLFKNSNFIGLVESGLIQIIKNDYQGNRVVIEEVETNQVFGSMISFINSKEYEIIAKEDAKVILIDYNQIFSQDYIKYEYYNQFLKNLLQIVTDKIAENNERIEILSKRTIRNKLLEYFRYLSSKTGTKTFYLPFSFTDLANYLAVDRCAMSRELGYLKEEGFIKISSRRITLLY